MVQIWEEIFRGRSWDNQQLWDGVWTSVGESFQHWRWQKEGSLNKDAEVSKKMVFPPTSCLEANWAKAKNCGKFLELFTGSTQKKNSQTEKDSGSEKLIEFKLIDLKSIFAVVIFYDATITFPFPSILTVSCGILSFPMKPGVSMLYKAATHCDASNDTFVGVWSLWIMGLYVSLKPAKWRVSLCARVHWRFKMLIDDGLTPLLSSPTCLCSLRSCLTC